MRRTQISHHIFLLSIMILCSVCGWLVGWLVSLFACSLAHYVNLPMVVTVAVAVTAQCFHLNCFAAHTNTNTHKMPFEKLIFGFTHLTDRNENCLPTNAMHSVLYFWCKHRCGRSRLFSRTVQIIICVCDIQFVHQMTSVANAARNLLGTKKNAQWHFSRSFSICQNTRTHWNLKLFMTIFNFKILFNSFGFYAFKLIISCQSKL